LTIHPHLEPMLRMSGVTALLPQHAFMVWAGMALPFPSPHIGFLVPYVLVTIFLTLDVMHIRLQ